MRLHWFLPYGKGKRRGGRKLLLRLGPSWAASPVRRIIQVGCLAVFLYLFLFVAWPYTAHRAAVWPGWVPVSVDEQTGEVTLAAEGTPGSRPAVHESLFPVDSTAVEQTPLGEFRVDRESGNELVLTPTVPATAAQIEQLTMSFGPWTLHQADPQGWPSHYATDFLSKEVLPAESFLAIDPLATLLTALASRTWVRTLNWTLLLLLVCLFIPRGFCGYICPLGTLIDLFDAVIGRRVQRFRAPEKGWWVHVRYYLLTATLVAAALGIVLSGFLAAIPLLTRGFALLIKPLQTAAVRDWHQVPPLSFGHYLSIALFVGVFLLGLFGRRFWCRYICPTGAIFSLASLLRITERRVSVDCVSCGKCVDACAFDAIADDFTSDPTDCMFCQTCGGACPVGAIQFGLRWQHAEPSSGDREVTPAALPRRGFLASAIGLAVGTTGGIASAAVIRATASSGKEADDQALVRPPGSVPEELFLRMCVRCGECLQACPNDVLQPTPLAKGFNRLWTPRVVANWSGCEPSCNNCGQVCPTGAIRALSLEEKRAARIGLAVIDQQTCLPYAGQQACQLCVDECNTAGYRAIEFLHVGTELDDTGRPVADSGFLAPVVRDDLCVGCGLCQVRCFSMNAVEKKLLKQSAVVVRAGQGREDRLPSGSYIALREEEERRRQQERQKLLPQQPAEESYLPDFLRQ